MRNPRPLFVLLLFAPAAASLGAVHHHPAHPAKPAPTHIITQEERFRTPGEYPNTLTLHPDHTYLFEYVMSIGGNEVAHMEDTVGKYTLTGRVLVLRDSQGRIMRAVYTPSLIRMSGAAYRRVPTPAAATAAPKGRIP